MVTYKDISAAAGRLAPFINRTPLLESESVNDQLGGRLFLKAECLQKTGSFKFRGATNRISQLSEEEKKSGVVAYSSGNHAQGIALAAKLHGAPATIVMPIDAPQMKIKNTERHDARVVLYDRYTENREEIGESIAAETGAVLVPPFDDPHIIAGQGTVGLEVAAQAEALGVSLDYFLAPISGGGLSAGCSVALAEKSPETKIYVAEPAHYDDSTKSLAAGERLRIQPTEKSICDALLQTTPGELTFPLLKSNGAQGVTASDEEVKAAMRLAFGEFKLVVEPGGAVALAAILSGRLELTGKAACVVCTGGNVDAALIRGVIS